MLYTVKELATIFDLRERTLRDWLAAGAPHTRDQDNHVWIQGREFAARVTSMRKPKKDRRLTDQDAYCMRCAQPVEMVEAAKRVVKGNLMLITGQCPKCGCRINRGGRTPTDNTIRSEWKDTKNGK